MKFALSHIKFWFILVTLSFTRLECHAATAEKADRSYLINCFFDRLYNFSFNEADSIAAVMEKNGIDDATMCNIRANLAWWRLLSGDAISANTDTCEFYLDKSLKAGPGENPDLNSLFNIIYAYSLKSRLENYKGNSLKAFLLFRKSFTYIGKCTDSGEKNDKLDLLLGLYYYFTNYFRDQYLMMSALFFPLYGGDRIKGLKYLEECSGSSDAMVRTEASYFLMKIYTTTEKNLQKAYRNAQALTMSHPQNFVYGIEQLKLMMAIREAGEVGIYRERLIRDIQMSGKINKTQKDHFLSQIELINKKNM